MSRPKKQDIVLMWLAVERNYRHFLDNTFTIPELADLFCGGSCEELRQNLTDGEDPVFADDEINKLVIVRTTAFISIVYSANIMAYTCRSFTEPIWVEIWSNTAMQKGILFAQIALYLAVFIPGLSDTILLLPGADIGWIGWVAAWIGGFSTLVLCELYKFAAKGSVLRSQQRVADSLMNAEQERLKLANERKAKMAGKIGTEVPAQR